jgi:hypothetical protein
MFSVYLLQIKNRYAIITTVFLLEQHYFLSSYWGESICKSIPQVPIALAYSSGYVTLSGHVEKVVLARRAHAFLSLAAKRFSTFARLLFFFRRFGGITRLYYGHQIKEVGK